MPSSFLSNSASTPTSNLHPSAAAATSSASDSRSDALSLASSSSSSSSAASRLSEMWKHYLWIPFLISLSKELSLAKAQSGILLPGEFEGDSSPRCTEPEPTLNYRPVIGILSHPGDGASGRLSNASNVSYIAASYVKFIESAGARVIPLIYNEPPDILFQVKPLLYIFNIIEKKI